MGNSKSKSSSTNEVKQTVINKTDIDIVNKQINNAVAKAAINTDSSCIQTTNQSQLINLSGCKVGGNLKIGETSQTNVAVVKFSCIQANKVSNEMAMAIMTEVIGQIQSKLDSQTLANMDAYAGSQAAQGFGAIGGSSSSSNSTNKYDLKTINTNNTNIQNIMKSSIQAEFDVNTVQKCINNAEQQQALDLSACEVGGDLDINKFSQSQSIENVSECLQENGVANSVTKMAETGLGIVVDTETKTETTVEMKSKSESKAENTGPIGEIGKVIDGLFGGICDCQNTSIYFLIAIIVLTLLSAAGYYLMSNEDKESINFF
jgi:hypothetical protein